MRLTVNGEGRDVPEGTSLAGLLDQLGAIRSPMVVARNGRVVGRADYEAVRAGRREIVRFDAGG